MEYLRTFGPSRIVLVGTRTAKGFYEKMGFSTMGSARGVDVRGVSIECFDMEWVAR